MIRHACVRDIWVLALQVYNFTMFTAMTWLNTGPHRGKHSGDSLATLGTQHMAAHGPDSKQNILPTTHNKSIRLLKSNSLCYTQT